MNFRRAVIENFECRCFCCMESLLSGLGHWLAELPPLATVEELWLRYLDSASAGSAGLSRPHLNRAIVEPSLGCG